MRLLFSLLFTLLIGIYAYPQDDSKSKSILDKVASASNSYKTIKLDFKFITNVNLSSDQQHLESGNILMKGTKYHLALLNSDIVFDGKSIYTYLKEPNEINISKPEPTKVDKGDFFFSNPRDIFKGYNKNFKSTFIKETNVNKIICH